jgi:hypothetical protein
LLRADSYEAINMNIGLNVQGVKYENPRERECLSSNHGPELLKPNPETSMDDVVLLVLPLEVRNLQRLHRLQSPVERFPRRAAISATNIFLNLAQRTQNPRPIESLTFTMIAVTHRFTHRCLKF